ncbi:MAG: glycoside hydrolase family 127 protein [Bacteroidota bacterium]|nr:glycoside hydrolase family 127 protein [Bacteroidota bacterium]
MKSIPFIKFLVLSILLITINSCDQQGERYTDYPIQPVSFNSVKVSDHFWAPRIQRNSEVTIPIAFQQSEETGRIKNFKVAAGMEEGGFCSKYPFDDSDVFKIMEGAAYSLQTFPDPELEAYLDTLIHYIGGAQEEDGYLYTNRSILGDSAHPWAGDERWELVHEFSHELYNLGHMFEAAVAYYQATGKEQFLNIAIKAADLVDQSFGEDIYVNYPGHQEIEIGLVKLYRVTGNECYLKLARFFLEARENGPQYCQAHKKVSQQDTAVGHAVRAMYMYAAMTDIAALMNNKNYEVAIRNLWKDVVHSKMYITGGIGAEGGHEGFGNPYELPNLTAYCETCAAIAFVLWNHRLFLLHGDAKYYDVLERTLYNGLLSGVSLSGDRFFYPNPLESHGGYERKAWFGCACCPANIARFIPSVPGYMYAVKDNQLYVNLFIESRADITLADQVLSISQKSNYPWEGQIELTLDMEQPMEVKLSIRIPGWSENDPVPGDLYRFEYPLDADATIFINGEESRYAIHKGYAILNRTWNPGDQVRVEIPMPIRKVLANEKVGADLGKVALQRGPLVYCTEWPDQHDAGVLDIALNSQTSFESSFQSGLLDGVEVIKGSTSNEYTSWDGGNLSQTVNFTSIPYYAWANRGPGAMRVWLPEHESHVLDDDDRMAWWWDARFGMFIHWGLYAIPAGEWKGETNHAEWIRTTAQIPLEVYDGFVDQFNPVDFDAEQWVQMAKNAGMKYIVITSKHHDGFCLFDSEYTDFDVKSTPFDRDIMKELADACHREGIRICWYHSIMDWHHPDYLPGRNWEKNRGAKKADFDAYVEHMKKQLQELVGNYGDIGVLWFDGEWEETWSNEYGKEIYQYVRGLQPSIIINNRVGVGRGGSMEGLSKGREFAGDFGTPEQQIPPTGLPGVDWESCITMNNHWGYNKNDDNWKSTGELIRMLADIASKGGNFLLNVGPTSKGLIPGPSVERLKAIGEWMKLNGEAIYGTQASPFKELEWGRCTQKTENGFTKLYLHVFDWPSDQKLIVAGIYNKPVKAWLLADRAQSQLPVQRHEDAIIIDLPKTAPDKANSVVVLEIEGIPDVNNPPEIRAEHDIFIDKLQVEISSDRENVEIRYTVDGSVPDANAKLVSRPVSIYKSKTIKARCFRDGKAVSGTVIASYQKVQPEESAGDIKVQPGLKYEYFQGEWDSLPDFNQMKPRKKGTIDDFDFSPGKQSEYFGFQYTGYIDIPADGVYTFYTISDDGSCLYIDDLLVVDNDGLHGMTEMEGTVALQKGYHPIRVTFFEKNGGDDLIVLWKSSQFDKLKVSPERLYY